jgi:hypothetical protein
MEPNYPEIRLHQQYAAQTVNGHPIVPLVYNLTPTQPPQLLETAYGTSLPSHRRSTRNQFDEGRGAPSYGPVGQLELSYGGLPGHATRLQ